MGAKNFESLLGDMELEIIDDLEIEARFKCQHLKNVNRYYYCSKDMADSEVTSAEQAAINYDNPIIKRNVDLAELQLWCMDTKKGSCEKCIIYQGEFSPEKKILLGPLGN